MSQRDPVRALELVLAAAREYATLVPVPQAKASVPARERLQAAIAAYDELVAVSQPEEPTDVPREDWLQAHAAHLYGAECDACGSPATRYDLDGQWCDVHDRTSACVECGELDCPGHRLPVDSQAQHP